MGRKELIQAYMQEMGSMRRLMLPYSPVIKGMKSNLTHAQIAVLIVVSQNGPGNIRELAKRLHMTSSAVTQTVNALVDANVLKRSENALDRRQILVSLTPRGVRMLSLAKMHRTAALEALLKPLSETDLELLVSLYRKINASAPTSLKR